MKKISLPILLLVSLLAGGCSCSNSPASSTEPSGTSTTPTPRKYGFYELKDGVDESSLQGSPWLNTSIVGMVNKINKPSIKDDFFANVNYETLSTNTIPEGSSRGGGYVYQTDDFINARLKDIKETTPTFVTLKNLMKTGAKTLAKADADQYFNMSRSDFNSYASNKEFLSGSSPLITVTNDKGVPTLNAFSVAENEGIIITLSIYIMGKQFQLVPDLLADIAEAEGYDRAEFKTMMDGFVDELYSYIVSVVSSFGTTQTMKVSQLNEVFNATLNMKKIVNDLGLDDEQDIAIAPNALAVNTYIENCLKSDEGFENLKKLLGIFKVFENRFFIGAKNVQTLYVEKLSKTPVRKSTITANQTEDEVSDAIASIVFPYVTDKAYSQKYITTAARTKMTNLISDVIAGFTTVLENNDWLTNQTKQKALEKIAAMKFEAFYSDEYEAYTPFEYSSSDVLASFDDYSEYFINGLAKNAFSTDALHTNMSVTTINAAYLPGSNSFRIYHGIVAPFIDEENSIEELYGRIGVVIGHEITHGFDSSGADFDKDGERHNWWSQEDKAKFNEKVTKMANYYTNNLSVLKDEKMNGTNLTGEIIADMGGMKTLLVMASKVNGFDYDKFFRNNALFYNFSYTESAVRDCIENDPHPIGYLRVNMTAAQFDKFQETYNLKVGDGMYIDPADRLAIW